MITALILLIIAIAATIARRTLGGTPTPTDRQIRAAGRR